jgi:magnesium-transporting ATPase (P-type)
MFRKIVSLTLLLSALCMLLTGLVLFIQPHGSVARWLNWSLLSLNKDQWSAVHVNMGVLMISLSILHLYLNWKPLLAYLRNRAKKMVVINRQFLASLLITAYVGLGTIWGLPPMQQFLNLSENIKQSYQISTAATHSDASTQTQADPFLSRIQDWQNQKLGRGSGGGIGRLTLNEACRHYGLNCNQVIARLHKQNIVAMPSTTIREMTDAVGGSAQQILKMIKGE